MNIQPKANKDFKTSPRGDKVTEDGSEFYCVNDGKSFAFEKTIKHFRNILNVKNNDRRDSLMKGKKKIMMRNHNIARFLSSLDDESRPFSQQSQIENTKTKKNTKNKNLEFVPQSLLLDEDKLINTIENLYHRIKKDGVLHKHELSVDTEKLATIVEEAVRRTENISVSHEVKLAEVTPEFSRVLTDTIVEAFEKSQPKVDVNVNLPRESQCNMVTSYIEEICSVFFSSFGNEMRMTTHYFFTTAIQYVVIILGISITYDLLMTGASNFMSIWNYFVRGKSEEFVPQMTNDEWWTQLVVVISQFCGSGFNTKSILNLISNFKKKTDGVKDFFVFMRNSLEVVVNYFRENIMGLNPVSFDQNDDKTLKQWLKSIRDLQIKDAGDTLKLNTATYDTIKSLRVLGRELSSKYDDLSNRDLDRVRVVVKTGNGELEKLMEIFKRHNFGKVHLRPKPLTLALIGASGVGKSAVTVPLLNAILARTIKSEEELELFETTPSCFIYSRAAETGFWDGYHGQKAVVYDDFLQANPNKAHGNVLNEAFEIIRASNIFPQLLHKAHLDDKGNSYMEARVILCSSNNMGLKSEMISEDEALWRRFEAVAQVVPKIQYCRPGTEKGPIHDRRLMDMDHFSLDVYEFHLMSYDGTTWRSQCSMPYLEFVDYLVAKYDNLSVKDYHYKEEIARLKSEEVEDKRYDLAAEYFDDEESSKTEVLYESSSSEFHIQSAFEEAQATVERERSRAQKVYNYFEEIFSYLKVATDKLLNWFKEKVKEHPIISLLTATIGALSIAKFCSSFRKCQPQSHAYHEPRIEKKCNKARTKGKLLSFLYPENDGSPFTEAMRSIIRKNSYVISTEWSQRAGLALVLKDKLVGLNAHYYHCFKKKDPETDITFTPLVAWCNDSDHCAVKIKIAHLLRNPPTKEMESRDFWVVNIENMRPHKSIVNHFVEEKFLSNSTNIPFLMVRVSPIDKEISTYDGYSPLTDLKAVGLPMMDNVIKYQVPTTAGDCGSVVFVNDKHSVGTLLGLHYCGNGSYGAATILTRQFVESITSSYLPQCSDHENGCLFHLRPLTLNLGDHDIRPPKCAKESTSDELITSFGLERIGTVEKPLHVCRKSKLRATQFYSVFNGYIYKFKYPAVLVADPDPYDVAISKYATPDCHIGSFFCTLASQNYMEKIKKHSYNDPRDVLSFEIACTGIHGDSSWNSIPRKTSPGYPWSDICKKGGKKDFFGEEGDYTFDSPQCQLLRKRVEYVIYKAKRGQRLLHLYCDAMKDELRSEDKVIAKKTRLISGAPLDYVVCCRMYFGSFVSSFIKRRIYNGSAVGINGYSIEWTDLANYLLRCGSNIIAGDFSGFDTTQTKEILWEIFDIIDKWYGDENSGIRKVLWMDVVNSVHFHGDELLIMEHCLPSGHPLTSIINTMYVNILFRMCWMKIQDSARSIEWFDNFVSLVAYGDDNICAVHDSPLGAKFNYQTLSKAMKFFGMEYTDEDKQGVDNIGPYKELSECSFLKRGFIFKESHGRWIAPLDFQTVLQLPYYYRDGFDERFRTWQNITCFFRELTLHGEEIYKDLTQELWEYSEKHTDIDIIVPPFEVLFEDVIGNTWGWNSSEDESGESVNSETESTPLDLLAIEPYCQGEDKSQGLSNVVEMGENHDATKTPAIEITLSDNDVYYPQSEGQFGNGEQITGTTQTGQQDHKINTTFSDDAETRIMQPFPISDLKIGKHLHVGDAYRKDSVIDFLKTPVMIKNFNITSSAVANTTLDTTILPFDSSMIGFGTDTGVGMFLKRLNAYLGFRATAVLRFQVNCNRFAQGRLLIHYIPGQIDNPQDAVSHRFDLTTKSQNPRTELNLNRDTSCIFRVPYVSANVAYDLSGAVVNTRVGKMGNLYTTVYSPLVGATTLNISIFLSFEDVELITPSYTTQMNTSDEEQKRGLLSGPLTITSEALTKMSQIPSLSSIMGSASWFIKACAKSAEAFGYSKPNNEHRLQRVTFTKNAYQLNYDGDEDNYKMGFSAANKIDILPGFAGNDIDEMSIEYLCNRPAYVNTYVWTSATTVNTSLININLGPSAFENTTVVGTRSVRTMPPFSMLARFFGYWRADIIITLKIVKTEFHTGKFVALYRPGVANAVSPDAGNFVARQVVDVKESDTFSFECRYASLTPFVDQKQFSGNFSCYVLNSLNAPASVSSSVSILVEVSAKNVMFTLPSATVITPATGSTAVFTPQMDEGNGEKYFIMGDFKSSGIDPNISRFCAGEHITSIKQLLHRKCLLKSHATSSTNIKNVVIKPFTIAGSYYDGTSWTDHPMSSDYYSILSCCYVLQRGSVRYSFYNNLNNDHAVSFAYETLGPLLPFQTNSSAQSVYYTGTVFQSKQSMSGYLDIEVPHSSMTHSRECQTEFELLPTNFPLGTPSTLVYYSSNLTFSNFTDVRIQRSVGDDFQLGFFVGVPSVVINEGVRTLS